MNGRLLRIWLKRARGGPMDPREQGVLEVGQGLIGNAHRGGRRQVTLIEERRWNRVREALGEAAEPVLRRANLLVAGVCLAEGRGRILRIGDCRVRIGGETRPCRKMDEALPGLQAALEADWGGGAYGEVLSGGIIRVGEALDWEARADSG